MSKQGCALSHAANPTEMLQLVLPIRIPVTLGYAVHCSVFEYYTITCSNWPGIDRRPFGYAYCLVITDGCLRWQRIALKWAEAKRKRREKEWSLWSTRLSSCANRLCRDRKVLCPLVITVDQTVLIIPWRLGKGITLNEVMCGMRYTDWFAWRSAIVTADFGARNTAAVSWSPANLTLLAHATEIRRGFVVSSYDHCKPASPGDGRWMWWWDGDWGEVIGHHKIARFAPCSGWPMNQLDHWWPH